MASIDKRIDVTKLDKGNIDRISSEIVRALTQVGEADPTAAAKLHIKIGHIKGGFSREGHFKVIIGGEPDEPETPAPSGGR